jgi:hypothetical protein
MTDPTCLPNRTVSGFCTPFDKEIVTAEADLVVGACGCGRLPLYFTTSDGTPNKAGLRSRIRRLNSFVRILELTG